MTYLFQSRWLLILCLCVFTICKLPHLHLGFYWDESWVYGPSVYTMYLHGPSLSPAAIPLEFSRGHPLLFQAMCATWMRIFGSSLTSVHSFALVISLTLAVTLYEIMRRLFNERTALISVILLLTDHFFFINSSFVLNDIMLGLFTPCGDLLLRNQFLCRRYSLHRLMLLYKGKRNGAYSDHRYRCLYCHHEKAGPARNYWQSTLPHCSPDCNRSLLYRTKDTPRLVPQPRSHEADRPIFQDHSIQDQSNNNPSLYFR
jgi:hypothetical protein